MGTENGFHEILVPLRSLGHSHGFSRHHEGSAPQTRPPRASRLSALQAPPWVTFGQGWRTGGDCATTLAL